MRRLIAGLVLALALSPCLGADPTWSFLRVRRDLQNPPHYVTSAGTATVRIDKRNIHIEAFDEFGSKRPALIFEGTIDDSGAIRATATLMNTDARPYAVQGKLHAWSREERWGDKSKIVTFREINFPFDPGFELYSFLSEEAIDQ
jgi:hypothetical protein